MYIGKMHCQGLNHLTGCGQHKINFGDKDMIGTLTSDSMHYIIKNILDTFKNNEYMGTNLVLYNSSYVLCNGTICIKHHKSKFCNNVKLNRHCITNILTSWLMVNSEKIHSSYNVMYLSTVLFSFNNLNNADKMIDSILNIKKVVNDTFEFTDD